MTDITPTIIIDGFSGERIAFRVDAGSCTDSAGSFEYAVFYEDSEGKIQNEERRQTWARTHNKSKFYVSDNFTLGRIKGVTLFRNSIKAQCYSRKWTLAWRSAPG
jgi:hypothetical protein